MQPLSIAPEPTAAPTAVSGLRPEPAAAARAPVSRRLPGVDMLKGCAALWVLLIHAEVMRGEPLMTHVFNRAAQFFVILIGFNSSLWWRRRDATALGWYANRFRRLYPPMWAAVIGWWILALLTNPPIRTKLSVKLFVAEMAGYLYTLGTGWFVTFAILVAIAFPVFVWIERRFGALTLLTLGIASTTLTFLFRFQVTQVVGFFDWMVFPPRLFAQVAFGIYLATRIDRFGRTDVAIAIALLAIYFGVPALVGTKQTWDAMEFDALAMSDLSAALRRLTDIPVCVLLLAGLQSIAGVGAIARPLAWLGNESYGMYLGQMMMHNALCYVFGFAALQKQIGGWGYAGLLLVGALAWVGGSIALRRARAHFAARA